MSNNRINHNAHAEVPPAPVTLRTATAVDAGALERLAQLDSSRIPAAPVLVAEVGDELRAAISMTDGHAVSDPFYPSADALAMLRTRRERLVAAAGSPIAGLGRVLGRGPGTRGSGTPKPSAPSVPGIPTLPTRA